MKDQSKTKQALIRELASLRQSISKLEQYELLRKPVVEALKNHEAELASIYEHATLIMLLVDKEWTIRKTNIFTAQYVGKAVGDIINLRCGESIHCIHSLDTPEGCGFGPACRECTLRLTAINTIETGLGHHEVEVMMSLFKDHIIWDAVFLLSSTKLTVKREPMALVCMQDITRRKQAEEELRTSRLQLRALATRLQQIREEERIRIAREIHDEMGSGLAGLKMDLSWLSGKMSDADPGETLGALINRIHTSNELIDQMIHAVRRISTDLRPSVLDDLGLIAALEWQAREFTRRTGIPCEFVSSLDYIYLEDETATGVFRIFQEALTNAGRHSGATKVVASFRESERSLFGDETLVLEIMDNGRGITEEEIRNPESLGLLGMKERVLAFGGDLSLRGEPGGGTALVLKIPQNKKTSPQA